MYLYVTEGFILVYVTSLLFLSNPCNPISAVYTLASTVSARRRTSAHLCFDAVF